KNKPDKTRLLSWVLTLLASIFLLEAAYLWLNSQPQWHTSAQASSPERAEVLAITGQDELRYQDGSIAEQVVSFTVRLRAGGEQVEAVQYLDGTLPTDTAVAPGDQVLVIKGYDPSQPDRYYFGGFYRLNALGLLAVLFLAGLLILGRLKGLNTILSLALTCGAVFFVLIPAILAGQNIYVWSILICAYITGSSLLLLNGYRRKTLVAISGCIGGVLVSGLLTLLMNGVLRLSGLVDEQSALLLQLAGVIDLRGILFGGILIGAVGAVMDVAMSVSAALHELSCQLEKPTFRGLLRSGLTIGQDMMGTMANTLILAYIGSSLTTVVLLAAFNNQPLSVLNSEMIVSELLQALAGSIGILVAIPFTSLLAAALFSRKKTVSSDSLPPSPPESGKAPADEG
ncbi:MAG: YibE/F family protein, partial [Oscillospiraceae bacterium]|nr:YibE/F family protein [Oscillospiraceae bacterium]